MADTPVRSRAVQAFDGASAAAGQTGDRWFQETLHRMADWARHPDTSDETLAEVMKAFAAPTTAEAPAATCRCVGLVHWDDCPNWRLPV